MNRIPLELLAPSKDLEHGREAIRCGADALYIGPPRFGARYAAGNSIGDISTLCREAHLFGVRVYATLNTILFDDEIDDARKMALSLCEAGVDALIVQDMAFCTFDLPIALHASTQAAALMPERAAFLASAGIERLILERSLSLDEIKRIREAADIGIETFVHGAICVARSGQCHMGHTLSGRSGNRGVCSQPCRQSYDLTDAGGRIILKDKHLLSLCDLDLSGSLADLTAAGVTSFKIEGRLKDIAYLRNSVLHYRRALDGLIAANDRFTRASWGETLKGGETVASKVFSRGTTTYYLHSKQRGVSSFDTPKAFGEPAGRVAETSGGRFRLEKGSEELHNGDGICFKTSDGTFSGTNINRAEGGWIEPNRMEGIGRGTQIFRNYDHLYISDLMRRKPERRVKADITAIFGEGKTLWNARSSTGATALIEDTALYETAKNPATARDNIERSLERSGDTIFAIENIILDGVLPFISVSTLNSIRRELLEKLTEAQSALYKRPPYKTIKPCPAGVESLDYRANVTNSAARRFYEECGVKEIEEGVELKRDFSGIALMTTKYCILREAGLCGTKDKELFLENEGLRLPLRFDCDKCEMTILWD